MRLGIKRMDLELRGRAATEEIARRSARQKRSTGIVIQLQNLAATNAATSGKKGV